MPTRTFAVAAAGVGAAVLAATGITYAATSGSSPASPSVHQRAAPVVHRAAQPDQRAAQPEQRAAPAAAPESGGGERGGGRDREGGGRDFGRKEEGRIYFNDRVYSAAAEGCITTASGLGSSSFNVFNDSRRTIEVFRGFTCDNGAPVATVGPHGATNGVVTRTVQGSLFGDDGVVGSFLVLADDEEDW
ncbi:hypothetical protein ACFC08_30050 [Streptomyces sp. NPDC056112]|uniref:hypothetical protein n=1 Tax=unclassified Streptomyces TaxID=2593676 RepID=UPI0024805427|nr:hypothetical protein [Streptomyces sp. HYC2]